MAKKKTESGFQMPKKALDIEKPAEVSEKDADLLTEMRADYRAFLDYWRENRDEMEVDMRYAGADAFDAKDRKEREGRPCETPDELSQYVKQTNNNIRQNKRDSKISPSSEDATGEDAEKREAVLRGLNHRGDFQAAFQTGFECCTWSGLGAFGIGLHKTADGHLEPYPRRFPNQFAVLLDPYAKKADYSDQKKCFLVDVMRKSDFEEEWPNAQKKSFSADDAKMAPDWVLADEIVIAEAWRKEKGFVWQYITNGIEILDKIKWPGSWIPIIPILGEEIYVVDGGRAKRKYLSLIRRARTPQKFLAYIASQELEEFGQAPRAPFIGYKGQFTSPDWATINTQPKPYIEVEALDDPLNPGKVLPLPTRPQYIPNAAAYETAREAWRRGIQSAIGIMPMPTAAQRQNEKSGVALEKIQNQEAIGSYHFTDNADRALVNYGRQMNELIKKGMTGDRHVGTKNQDDTHGLIYLTTSDKGVPPGVDPADVLFVDKGDFDVTLSVGPSHESQRDEASDFVDTLISNMKTLPIPPPIAIKILAIAVKMKNVGHLGDEIADLLDPKEGDPQQQAMQAMQKLQQQQEQMAEVQKELEQLRMEKQGKVIDNQFKIQLQQMKNASDEKITQLSNDVKILGDFILAKRAQADQELEMYKTFWVENHNAAHDLGMQQQAHANAQQLSDQQHQQQLEQGQQSGDQQAQLSAQNADQAQTAAEAQPSQ